MAVIADTVVVERFLTNPTVDSGLERDGVVWRHDHGSFVHQIAGDLPLNL